jgi:hypothetical protein
MLFDRRLGGSGLQRLDISSNMDRLDIDELDNAVLFEPGEEIAGSPVIGHAGVLVADRRSKELQEPARRLIAGVGDCRRHGKRTVYRRCPHRRGHLDDGGHARAFATHAATRNIKIPRMRTSPGSRLV